MDIALGIIAILGFGLSVYNFVLEIVKSRKHLKVLFNHVFRFGDPEHCTEVIHISVCNNSSKPICVTKMEIACGGRLDRFGEFRKVLLNNKSMSGNQVNWIKTWTSDTFPVKIDPGDVFCGLIASSNLSAVLEPDERCSIFIKTNRGPKKLKSAFTNFSDAELLSQCRESD